MSSDTSVLEHARTDITPAVSHGDGDHDRFAHYVNKAKWGNTMLTGEPVTALCGKRWVPSKDASKFPVCPDCKAVYEQMQPGDPDNPDYKP